MENEQKQVILFFGLTTTRNDYLNRIVNGEFHLKNVTVDKETTWVDYSFDLYLSHLRDVLRTKGAELTTPEKWEKFSYEWPDYIKSEYRDLPLWKDYYYHTQVTLKNRFAHLYKGTVAQPYFFVKAYSKNYIPDEFSVLKLPDSKELGRYIYSELAKDPNANLGEHRYGFAKKGKLYSPSLHMIRGSKIGVDIAKTNPNVTIYFLLDGLDMKRVLTKPRVKKPTSNVTNHELRYVYRNWSQLEGKIVFFKNGKEVSPPWESFEYKKMWQAYKPKRFQKHNWIRRKWMDFRNKKGVIQQGNANAKYNMKKEEQMCAFATLQQQIKQDKPIVGEDSREKNRPCKRTFFEKTVHRVEKIAYRRNEAVASKGTRQRERREPLRS
ncbi:hypothetical protein [Candidatus Enterococcus mangumiae]|uniref:DUF3114 domain-containing protein n=1 Tax=Candidatus Enterococcus mangumiae TaxID=2230878 RepID=A0ABZ2SUU2_9ENTE|nr:hypothetical protein [Enterococcus sp. DIV1094]MBO0488931.1 hypothetical protein [Enterococcus sp. DIV1094]